MKSTAMLSACAAVALLAEGVDRNSYHTMFKYGRKCVALLAEGVDRNVFFAVLVNTRLGRPPRGGRG